MADVKPLGQVAAHIAEQGELFCGLHALGHNLEPEVGGQGDVLGLSDVEPFAFGVGAELLWRAGRKKEAAAEARAASIIANEERTTSIIARGHLPVIHERFVRIAGGKT